MRKQEVNVNSMDAPKRPFKKWKCGNIEAAIWNNKREMQEGEEFEFKTVSLSRSYRKKGEDIWRNDAIHIRRNDLQKMILVLEKAQEELLLTEGPGDDNEE
tara:strand:- start:46 stop:348 length:303 start_codon:yes stop_codon:yes gene_type:complete